jgi:long-chain acyl-CoA synthetase
MATGESDRIVGLQEVDAIVCRTHRYRMNASAPPCSIPRHHRPAKGVLRPLPEQPATYNLPLFDFLVKIWQYREGMIYLSPAPLYHSAPQAAVNLAIKMGGTVIIMESFDPERYLELVERGASRTPSWCRRCSRAC